MLPSTSCREALLACPPPSSWNLLSLIVESTISFPCSRSDLPLSRQGAALAHLDSLSLMIWHSGLTALFLFLLAKAAPAFLPTALSVTPRPLLSFTSFSAEACAILHALCWSRQHQQVSHFSFLLLLSDSRSVLTTLSSPPSFLLSQTLRQIWQELSCLSSCFIRLQWVPGHSFLPGDDAANALARRSALLAPSAIPYSHSPLISRIHFFLFSDWRRNVSSKFFDTGPLYFHRGTCASSSCSLCPLSSSLQRT